MIKIVIMLLLLAGCTLAPKKNNPMAVYDFGVQQSIEQNSSPSFNASILVANVTAPIWLDNQAIHYRLGYHDPTRSYTYANSRWVASPAKMLTRRIKDYLVTHTRKGVISSHEALKADYALHIELEEFTQVFDHPENSRVIVRMRASLIDRSARQLITQREFSSEQNTPTADAAGAITALISASDTVLKELLEWLKANFPEKHSA